MNKKKIFKANSTAGNTKENIVLPKRNYRGKEQVTECREVHQKSISNRFDSEQKL